MDILVSLYKTVSGRLLGEIVPLPGAGSNRKYCRLTGEPTLIGVCGTSVDENKAFIYMSRHFEEKGLPVPRVHAVSDDFTHYLQDDLGDMLLFKAIESGRQTGQFSDNEKALLRKTIRLLPKIQFEGAEGMDFSVCHPQPEFNRRSVFWDLNYFKYCFLKTTGLEFQENLLEDDFERMADDLLSEEFDTFMYRDFQSRNVMLRDGEPYFIDFQGGRKGPIYYDVASFLWQAKANLPQSLRDELISEYLDALKPYSDMTEEHFLRHLRLFVLFRTLQVLGAYGFRGYFERKQHFLESIPFALKNVRQLLAKGFEEYPYLSEVLGKMRNEESFEMRNEE